MHGSARRHLASCHAGLTSPLPSLPPDLAQPPASARTLSDSEHGHSASDAQRCCRPCYRARGVREMRDGRHPRVVHEPALLPPAWYICGLASSPPLGAQLAERLTIDVEKPTAEPVRVAQPLHNGLPSPPGRQRQGVCRPFLTFGAFHSSLNTIPSAPRTQRVRKRNPLQVLRYMSHGSYSAP